MKDIAIFINESQSKFDILMSELRKFRDSMPTKKDKEALIDRYDLDCQTKNKDIEKALLRKMLGESTGKDMLSQHMYAWNQYWESPSSTKKIKEAVAVETIEFIKYIIQQYTSVINSRTAQSWQQKEYPALIKALNSIIEERTTTKEDKDYKKELLDKLVEDTRQFHDKFIEDNQKYWSNQYDNFKPLFGLKKQDIMSLIGVEDKIHRSPDDFYTSPVKKIRLFDKEYEAKEVNLGTQDLSKFATRVLRFISRYSKVSKSDFLKKMREDTEEQYMSDMQTVIKTIDKYKLTVANINVQYINNDAKGFEMYLTDGESTIHTRAIFAAEFSIKVQPHYRFIATLK